MDPTIAAPTVSSRPTPRFERARRVAGIARLGAVTDLPSGLEHEAVRLCEAARAHLGVEAAALYLGERDLVRRAISGVCSGSRPEPPQILSSDDLDAWAAADLLESVRIPAERGEPGFLLLFGGNVEPLAASELELLGEVVAAALARARGAEELRRSMEARERAIDQALRTERLRALGDMALGIAHQFNNVLNAMLGQLGALELLVKHQPALHGPVEHLRRVALDGARTVSRLQDFSRKRRDQEFVPLDLSAALRPLIEALRTRRRFPCVDDTLQRGVRIAGDVEELRDAFMALVDNAVDAGAQRLSIAVEGCGDEARLIVADDGAGMPREVRKRAFDPFFTTKGPAATGLGLSVAYGVVRRHGGRIELDSVPGQGTRVRIRIPTLPASAEIPQPAGPPSHGPLPAVPLRVLLVEDDGDNRDAMAALLGLGGHVVTPAATGGEGVGRFNPGAFDVVLTDLGLPDLTGWEVAHRVKLKSASTPVALITGWGLNLAADEIRRRGVDLLLKKPIDPRRFLEQIASLARPRPVAV